MQPYKNLSGRSGVLSYNIQDESIVVVFYEGSCRNYLYTYDSATPRKVEEMKQLAVAGYGLNSFINEHAFLLYARKW